jgi:hypothetical protein
MSRELGIDINNMHIALCRIPDNSFIVLSSCGISFDIDTESAVEFQLQSVSIVSKHDFTHVPENG